MYTLSSGFDENSPSFCVLGPLSRIKVLSIFFLPPAMRKGTKMPTLTRTIETHQSNAGLLESALRCMPVEHHGHGREEIVQGSCMASVVHRAPAVSSV
jgi:hypothetical protein